MSSEDKKSAAEQERAEQQMADQEQEAAAEAAAPEESADSLRQQLSEMTDRYLRSRAEMENYRKRVQREFEEIRTSTKSATIYEFLTVFDHFQMAMDHADQTPDFAALKQGMDLILAEFQRTFENLGVESIEASNGPFDPNLHEAVAQEASADVPAGNVVRQWKKGFRLGGRLLRPASVVVSSGSPGADEE